MPLTDAQLTFINRYITNYIPDVDAIPIEGTEADKKLITALRALASKIDQAVKANPSLNYSIRDLITDIRRDHKDQAGLNQRVEALRELDGILTQAIDLRQKVNDAFARARSEGLAAAPHFTDPRRAAVLEIIEAQEAALQTNLDNAERVIDDLKNAHDLRQFLDQKVPQLTTQIDDLAAPLEGIREEGQARLTALLATARQALDQMISPAGQTAAETAIAAAQSAHDDITDDIRLRQKIRTDLEALAGLITDATKADPGVTTRIAEQTAIARNEDESADDRAAAVRTIKDIADQAIAARKGFDTAYEAAKAQALDGADTLSDAQKRAIEAILTEQAALLNDGLDQIVAATAGLAKATELRTSIDGALAPLRTALGKIETPPDGALLGEKASYSDAVDQAKAAFEDVIPPDGLAPAQKAVSDLQNLRGKLETDLTRRAAATSELDGPALQAAATALGEERLTNLVELVHPPVKDLLGGGKVSLTDLASTIDGVFGGDVALFAEVLEQGCGRDVDKLKTFVDAFPADSDERAHLSNLVQDGGFDAAPGALGAMFEIGCQGDPTRLADLAEEYKNKDDRENLAGLLEKGGLGAAPEALGYVIKDAGAGKAKALGAAFQSNADLAKLDALVTQGGLGGMSARSPDTLASMLVHGVDDPADLKGYYDAFQAGGMDDFRAMMAAFDLNPPPSQAGKQFKNVASRVCPPPSDLHDVYAKSINKGARSGLAKRMTQSVTERPEVASALAAANQNNSPKVSAGVSTTMSTASALVAAKDVPGVDAAALDAAEKAALAMAEITQTMANAADLRDDPNAAQTAKETAQSPDPDALKTATQAAQALAAATPPTPALIDTAKTAAAQALDAAKLTEDDTARAALLDAADACFDAVKTATATLTQSLIDDVQTKSQADSKDKATEAKTQAAVAAPLGKTIFEKQRALTQAPPPPATAQADYNLLVQAVTAAQAARDAVKSDRDDAFDEMAAAAERAGQARMAELALANPALAQAQAEAARLGAIAQAPGASEADLLAARDAATKAAKAMAAAAAAPLGPNALPTGIKQPNAGDPTADTNDANALYKAAITFDVALTAALERQELATEHYYGQLRATEKAAEIASRPNPSQSEIKAAIDGADAQKSCEQELEAAKDALTLLAKQAKELEKAVDKNIRAHKKRLKDAQDSSQPATVVDPLQDTVDALEETMAICTLILKRSYSVVFPAMSRDDLFKFSSNMLKESTAGMEEAEEFDPTDFPNCTVDTKHFCGRHTTKHFGFEGRDFFPEDELMDAAVMRTLSGGKDYSFPVNMMKTTSLWPFEFGETDVKACLKKALVKVKADKCGGMDIGEFIDTQTGNRLNFSDITINHNGADYTVQIGITALAVDTSTTPNTYPYEVGQFFPNSTPSVPFIDMHSIKSAMDY